MSLSKKRTGRITSSRVGAILGLSPFAKPDDVLREMVREYHGAEREFVGNIATQWGTDNEPRAVAEFEFNIDRQFEHTGDKQKFFVSEEHDWMGATPDGVYEKRLLEVKCPYSARESGKFKPLEIQRHYFAQIQIAMHCQGADMCYFVQWSPVNMEWEIVDRDDAWIADAIPKLKEFHERYLSELDNPSHLKPLRDHIANEDAAELVAEYDAAKEAVEHAQARQKAALAALVEYSGEHDSEICGRKLTKVIREGSISYANAIKDIAPDVGLEEYRGKSTEFWRFS